MENITQNYEGEESKMKAIENSNISTMKINLLARPSKPKNYKKPTKTMRRPIQINKLKKEFDNLNPFIIKQMNKYWEEYIDKIIGQNNIHAILSCELVGSKMEVIESKILSLVGIKGICVIETKNIFVLATEQPSQPEKVKIVILPKNVVNIKLQYREKEMLLYGKNWMLRPSERIENKTFKEIRSIDLQ